ncbi:MAG: acyl-[ACP]--phospholipid O-acyltransferase [Thalassobaculum sp.]|uniref:acyl-[ACP]--phospholipid O-acyltransferase n=1 Tax=Thalassobaculum sp. TaxID=2022740 RepID=UPI0032ED7133
MSMSEFSLLRSRRFLPLFVTQFLGAMNDNVFKNAFVILVLYGMADIGGQHAQVLVTVAAGIFILPYFLFSATAGQIADAQEKSRLIRRIKLAEIAIMTFGAVGLHLGDPYLLLGVLFLMGAQSAFFGPVKYGILPNHLAENELVGGNGLIEAGTFLAILVGTIAGGLLILRAEGLVTVSVVLLVLAVAGWLASRSIPVAEPDTPDLKINPNVMAETARIIRHAGHNRTLFLTILGLSWFWLVGATFLSQFPTLANAVLGADEGVVTLFLVAFSVGIAIGSLGCNALLKGEVSARYVPLAAIAMTVFIADLCLALQGRVPGETTIGAAAFLSAPGNWRILADLVGMAIAGGLYSVPLFAMLQARSEPEHRSRNIAANNIINALFMVVGAIWAALMLAYGLSVITVFASLAAVNAVVAVYICGLLPGELTKSLFAIVLRLLFRVRINGLADYRRAGARAVVVANHVSFLDGLLLAVFLPGKPLFAVDTYVAQRWWARPFLALIRVFTVDPGNPFATKALVKEVRDGNHLVIFPEGRITVTGALMKVHEGPGMIADKADADLIPVRIDGAEVSIFSRMKGKLRRRLFPRITITVLEPRRFHIPEEARGRSRRRIAGNQLYDVMSEMMFETRDRDETLFEALLDARRVHGGRATILDDIERKPANYNRVVTGALVLGRKLARLTEHGERVGVLLPNSVAAAVCLFALLGRGRVPALLNFSAGPRNITAATRTATLRIVLTSRRFIELGKLHELVDAIEQEARVVYLEDIRDSVSGLDKLRGLIERPFARAVHRRSKVGADDPAVVLFTSGSEGLPKGVVLSHANLLANRHQLAARVDFSPTDTVFNALPIFHSFGLTGGLILPMLSGVRSFLYPSPLHYRIVPALAYDTNATILFGTATFLAGYARLAHAYDFFNVRYVFAGAEKVKDETRRIWADKFGLRILEGYGATETAPVISVNTPMHYRAGTVGRLVPGLAATLEAVPGVEAGGRLSVLGPNVMLGYLLADHPGELQPTGGTYDTGDIVAIDDEGFLKILGRAKRFAKIAGEMVSLGSVEDLAARAWPEHAHAVIAVPDDRKGEQLVLLTTRPDATRDVLLEAARAGGIPELSVPRQILTTDGIPLLGTGKTDYPAVAEMVHERLGTPKTGES